MGVYGAADSTLVNMAYRAEMANVPLDQTAIFAQREENLKTFTSGISKLFENQWKDHKVTEQMRLDLGQEAEDILLSGGNVNEFQMENHHNTIHGYKDRLDIIKYDDTLDKRGKERARQKLEMEMNKYKNGIAEQKVIFEEMVNYSANGYIYNDMGSPEANTWNAILDDYSKGTNNAKQTVENGEIMYTYKGEKMSLKDIKKGLSKHDPEFQTEFATKLNDVVAQFKQHQKEGVEIGADHMTKIKSTLLKNVRTLDQVRNLANMTFGNDAHSFEQILHGQAKTAGVNGHEMIDNKGIELIYAELDKLSIKHGHTPSEKLKTPKDGGNYAGGNSPIDMDGDGDFDKVDQELYQKIDKSPENAKILIEKIKGNKELYAELVGNYVVENAVKDSWATGAFERAEAHRTQVEEDKRNLQIHTDKAFASARASSSTESNAQKLSRERYEADVAAIDKSLEAADDKGWGSFKGKKNRIEPMGSGKYKVVIDRKEVEILDRNEMGEELFKKAVKNYMLQKYENTRNTSFAS